MKKIRLILLLCVLACSILAGALVNAEPPAGSGLKKCTMIMFCEYSTHTLWYVYYCPWGELWVNMGVCY